MILLCLLCNVQPKIEMPWTLFHSFFSSISVHIFHHFNGAGRYDKLHELALDIK